MNWAALKQITYTAIIEWLNNHYFVRERGTHAGRSDEIYG